MALTRKLFLKSISTTLILSNPSLIQILSIYQNPAFIDTTNPLKQLNSAFNNSTKKTNIIVTSSII